MGKELDINFLKKINFTPYIYFQVRCQIKIFFSCVSSSLNFKLIKLLECAKEVKGLQSAEVKYATRFTTLNFFAE